MSFVTCPDCKGRIVDNHCRCTDASIMDKLAHRPDAKEIVAREAERVGVPIEEFTEAQLHEFERSL